MKISLPDNVSIIAIELLDNINLIMTSPKNRGLLTSVKSMSKHKMKKYLDNNLIGFEDYLSFMEGLEQKHDTKNMNYYTHLGNFIYHITNKKIKEKFA